MLEDATGMVGWGEAAPLVAQALHAMASGRPGPAVLECAIDVWGRSAPVAAIAAPSPLPEHPVNDDMVRAAAKRLGVGADVMVNEIANYGNTSTASIPLALKDALAAGRLAAGEPPMRASEYPFIDR